MNTMHEKTLGKALVWMRRDLRADDHAALSAALRQAHQVYVAFVFDTDILDALPRADRRVEFIRDSLVDLDAQLTALALSHGVEAVRLIVRHGPAASVLPALAAQLGVQAVFANHDDEPAAQARDAQVLGALANQGVAFYTRKDHVIFERAEILTATGSPFSVFTPYKNAWLKQLGPQHWQAWSIAPHAAALAPWPAALGAPGVPALQEIGFERTDLHRLKLPTGSTGAHELLADFLSRIDQYDEARDFPCRKGPSYLSTHLRFGTISIRQLVREAWQRAEAGSSGAQTWLSELIWRDFYHQILFHHPRVVTQAFKPEYDHIHWAHGASAEAHFKAWCEGQTGYPLVDAAMRQLAQTGYMHNRLRMVAASFLVKDLGLDWRSGEAWFALHLNDFDLAANNGGWQWAASTGCDAQPYFRIFNPVSQSEKFDTEGKFIRRYLPELAELDSRSIHAPWLAGPLALAAAGVQLGEHYPLPVVEHAQAREQTLARYAAARQAKPTARSKK